MWWDAEQWRTFSFTFHIFLIKFPISTVSVWWCAGKEKKSAPYIEFNDNDNLPSLWMGWEQKDFSMTFSLWFHEVEMKTIKFLSHNFFLNKYKLNFFYSEWEHFHFSSVECWSSLFVGWKKRCWKKFRDGREEINEIKFSFNCEIVKMKRAPPMKAFEIIKEGN